METETTMDRAAAMREIAAQATAHRLVRFMESLPDTILTDMDVQKAFKARHDAIKGKAHA